MALIKCPECGHDVSDKAKSCPNCGYVAPDTHNNKANVRTVIIICAVLIALAVAVLVIAKNRKKDPTLATDESVIVTGEYMLDAYNIAHITIRDIGEKRIAEIVCNFDSRTSQREEAIYLLAIDILWGEFPQKPAIDEIQARGRTAKGELYYYAYVWKPLSEEYSNYGHFESDAEREVRPPSNIEVWRERLGKEDSRAVLAEAKVYSEGLYNCVDWNAEP